MKKISSEASVDSGKGLFFTFFPEKYKLENP